MIDREQIADIVEEVTGDDRLRYAKPRTIALRIADRIRAALSPLPPLLGFDPTNHHNAAICPYCTPPEPAQYPPLAPRAQTREDG